MPLIGRTEDEGQLRDAWWLRRPKDDPGPAGRVLTAWGRLVQRSTTCNCEVVGAAAVAFGLNSEHAIDPIVTAAQALIGADLPAIVAAAEIATRVVAIEGLAPKGVALQGVASRGAAGLRPEAGRHPEVELLSLWLADLVLAEKLRWPMPIPLLATSITHPSLRDASKRRRARPGEDGWQRTVLSAYALAGGRRRLIFRSCTSDPKTAGNNPQAAGEGGSSGNRCLTG